MRGQTHDVSVKQAQHAIFGAADACGALSYGFLHRLDVRRRAGDHAQDFTRRGLLFERFVELLEQPHVLNGDHRLIGEGFEQLDLSLCERTDFCPANLNRTDCETITQQRRCQHSAKAGCYTEGLGPWELGFGCSEIMDVDRLPINDGPSRWRIASNRVSLAPG